MFLQAPNISVCLDLGYRQFPDTYHVEEIARTSSQSKGVNPRKVSDGDNCCCEKGSEMEEIEL